MKKYYILSMMLAVLLLIGCQPVSQEEKGYQSGLQAIDKKSFPQAIGIFSDLGDYKNSKELVSKLRYLVNGDYIGAGSFLIAAIKSDGTVAKSGGYEDSKRSADWKNIKALSTRGEYIEALDENGKLTTTSPATIEELQLITTPSAYGMMDTVNEMPNLEHVSAFQSSYPRFVVALLDNGTVKQVGKQLPEQEQAVVDGWIDIVAITSNGGFVVGLKADGTVVTSGESIQRNEVSQWKDIVAISTDANTIGLRKDGTVVAAGQNIYGECNVETWTDIIAVATGGYHNVGLKRDGTVVVTGDISSGQGNTTDWTDIVAIDASWYYTLGLKSDGTLVIAGDSSSSGANTPDVATISGLLVPTIQGR